MFDANFGEALPHRRSVYGVLVFVGHNLVQIKGGVQPTVAMSSTEAEYQAAAVAGKEMMAVRITLRDMLLLHDKPSRCKGDNIGSLFWMKAPSQQALRKHIDIKRAWFTERQECGDLVYEHIRTKYNLADILTKPLPASVFKFLRDSMMGPKYDADKLSSAFGESDVKI